ncbi:hypothetical protein BN2537_17169 [Streptomyces venezuelae]|nr:hypothetical protein BN2537_17169 [Streptomyces venezuelae]
MAVCSVMPSKCINLRGRRIRPLRRHRGLDRILRNLALL